MTNSLTLRAALTSKARYEMELGKSNTRPLTKFRGLPALVEVDLSITLTERPIGLRRDRRACAR